jgi:hypothetical protein
MAGLRGVILHGGYDGAAEVARVGAGSTGRPGSWVVGMMSRGVSRMRLVGEFLPGLPVSQAGELLVLTKSGGFGEAEFGQAVDLASHRRTRDSQPIGQLNPR